MGVNLAVEPEIVTDAINQIGIGFLYKTFFVIGIGFLR